MPRLCALLLLAALLTACGSAPPPAPHSKATEPSPAPAQGRGQQAGPRPVDPGQQLDQPLWPKPGTTVYAEGDQILTRAFAPFTYRGRTLSPVLMGDRVYLLRQEDGDVYMDGYVSNSGALVIHDQPPVLYRLPLMATATLELRWEHPNFGSGPQPFRVEEVAEFATKAGRFRGARLKGDQGQEQVWAEGIGVIRFGGTEAVRIEQQEPLPLPAITTLHDGTTALLTGGLRIVDTAGRILLDKPINWLRSQTWWANGGAPDPLVLYYTHTQAEPNRIYQAYAYNPKTRLFERVRWRTADGQEKIAVAGVIEESTTPGVIRFLDDERYPFTFCSYTWKGSVLACEEPEERLAQSEEVFAGLVSRPLDEVSWVRLFADPAVGRAAYQATRRQDPPPEGEDPPPQATTRNGLMFQYPVRQPDGSWQVANFRFTLVKQGADWRIATWEPR